jgi:hypothetical protein
VNVKAEAEGGPARSTKNAQQKSGNTDLIVSREAIDAGVAGNKR